MSVQLQFTGTDERWFETAITGKSRSWRAGIIGEVSDDEAALLIATGLFRVHWASTLHEQGTPQQLSTAEKISVDAMIAEYGSGAISKVSNAGMLKWFPATRASAATVNATPNRSTLGSFGVKLAVDRPFVAVRLVIVNRTANTLTGFRCTVGVSEHGGRSSNDETSQVKVGGSFYKVAAAIGSNRGHVPVTWAQAATAAIAGSETAVTYLVSDRIPLTSVARADGGEKPLLIIRADYDASASNCMIYNDSNVDADAADISTANRGMTVLPFGGTAMAATPANSGIAFNAGSSMWEIFPIMEYEVPTRTLLAAGDSLIANDGLFITTGAISSWTRRACADATTATRVWTNFNSGMSSKDSTEIWPRVREILAAGMIPDALLIQPASVNDNWATGQAAIIAKAKARCAEILAAARTYGIAFVAMLPVMPNENLDVTADAFRTEWNAWLSAYCAANRVFFLGYDGLGDGATPESWVAAYRSDAFHFNELGAETVLVPRLSGWLAAINA